MPNPMLKPLLWLIAISQLALAGLTMFAPVAFLGWMGLTPPAADNGYMFAMLGARFLAYGIGMIFLARQARPDRFWMANMALIQIVDFLAGAIYAGAGIVAPSVVAFPMVNAAIFALGLLWSLLRPQQRAAAVTPV